MVAYHLGPLHLHRRGCDADGPAGASVLAAEDAQCHGAAATTQVTPGMVSEVVSEVV